VFTLILAFDKIETHHIDVDLADLGASVLLTEVLDALLLNGNLLDEHIAQVCRLGEVTHQDAARRRSLTTFTNNNVTINYLRLRI
jgi:hypothetical protein